METLVEKFTCYAMANFLICTMCARYQGDCGINKDSII